MVGKEDLVLVPIEKLHTLRHICNKHFEKADYSLKAKRMKYGIPRSNLSRVPLTDQQLLEFPLHIFKSGELLIILKVES